jgi:hypothetical protein
MGDLDLPEFIEPELLREIETVEVPDEAILRCFVQVPKPFLSKSTVAEMTDMSDEGTRNRLNSLVERGILRSETVGKQTKIYWLNRPESQWPVPDDMDLSHAERGSLADTVLRINRLTTMTLFITWTLFALYILDWLSTLKITDGILEISMNWTIMPALAFVLFGILFYVALQTSLQVENEDAGWPTIRHVYEKITST